MERELLPYLLRARLYYVEVAFPSLIFVLGIRDSDIQGFGYVVVRILHEKVFNINVRDIIIEYQARLEENKKDGCNCVNPWFSWSIRVD